MGEIAYPSKRTFFKTNNGGGFTEVDQVTSSGDPAFQSNIDATTLYPALPSSGALKQGAIYSYNGGMVIVEQDHNRTIYTPKETPALFSVYRANTDKMEWIFPEQVIAGDERIFGGKTYICLQSHQTQKGWEPDKTPALWKLIQEEEIPVFVHPTGAHDVYMKGDKVHFPTINDPVYESLIDNNSWSPTEYAQGWRKLCCWIEMTRKQ